MGTLCSKTKCCNTTYDLNEFKNVTICIVPYSSTRDNPNNFLREEQRIPRKYIPTVFPVLEAITEESSYVSDDKISDEVISENNTSDDIIEIKQESQTDGKPKRLRRINTEENIFENRKLQQMVPRAEPSPETTVVDAPNFMQQSAKRPEFNTQAATISLKSFVPQDFDDEDVQITEETFPTESDNEDEGLVFHESTMIPESLQRAMDSIREGYDLEENEMEELKEMPFEKLENIRDKVHQIKRILKTMNFNDKNGVENVDFKLNLYQKDLVNMICPEGYDYVKDLLLKKITKYKTYLNEKVFNTKHKADDVTIYRESVKEIFPSKDARDEQFLTDIYDKFQYLTQELENIRKQIIDYYGTSSDNEYNKIKTRLNECEEFIRTIDARGDFSIIVSKEEYEDFIQKLIAGFTKVVIENEHDFEKDKTILSGLNRSRSLRRQRVRKHSLFRQDVDLTKLNDAHEEIRKLSAVRMDIKQPEENSGSAELTIRELKESDSKSNSIIGTEDYETCDEEINSSEIDGKNGENLYKEEKRIDGFATIFGSDSTKENSDTQSNQLEETENCDQIVDIEKQNIKNKNLLNLLNKFPTIDITNTLLNAKHFWSDSLTDSLQYYECVTEADNMYSPETNNNKPDLADNEINPIILEDEITIKRYINQKLCEFKKRFEDAPQFTIKHTDPRHINIKENTSVDILNDKAINNTFNEKFDSYKSQNKTVCNENNTNTLEFNKNNNMENNGNRNELNTLVNRSANSELIKSVSNNAIFVGNFDEDNKLNSIRLDRRGTENNGFSFQNNLANEMELEIGNSLLNSYSKDNNNKNSVINDEKLYDSTKSIQNNFHINENKNTTASNKINKMQNTLNNTATDIDNEKVDVEQLFSDRQSFMNALLHTGKDMSQDTPDLDNSKIITPNNKLLHLTQDDGLEQSFDMNLFIENTEDNISVNPDTEQLVNTFDSSRESEERFESNLLHTKQISNSFSQIRLLEDFEGNNFQSNTEINRTTNSNVPFDKDQLEKIVNAEKQLSNKYSSENFTKRIANTYRNNLDDYLHLKSENRITSQNYKDSNVLCITQNLNKHKEVQLKNNPKKILILDNQKYPNTTNSIDDEKGSVEVATNPELTILTVTDINLLSDNSRDVEIQSDQTATCKNTVSSINVPNVIIEDTENQLVTINTDSKEESLSNQTQHLTDNVELVRKTSIFTRNKKSALKSNTRIRKKSSQNMQDRLVATYKRLKYIEECLKNIEEYIEEFSHDRNTTTYIGIRDLLFDAERKLRRLDDCGWAREIAAERGKNIREIDRLANVLESMAPTEEKSGMNGSDVCQILP